MSSSWNMNNIQITSPISNWMAQLCPSIKVDWFFYCSSTNHHSLLLRAGRRQRDATVDGSPLVWEAARSMRVGVEKHIVRSSSRRRRDAGRRQSGEVSRVGIAHSVQQQRIRSNCRIRYVTSRHSSPSLDYLPGSESMNSWWGVWGRWNGCAWLSGRRLVVAMGSVLQSGQ